MPTGAASFITDADENTAKVKPRGQVFNTETYGLIKNPSAIMLTSESGGTEFPTVDIGKIIIRSWSGNNVVYVGGVAEDAPYSGHGMPVWPNETFTVPISNMNGVRVFACTSGNIISVMGFGTAENVTIPANDPIIPDITPPTLVSVSPLDGTSGVEIDLQEITATYDDELASGCVNTNTDSFTVRLSGSAVLVSGLAYVEEAQPTMAVFAPESGQLQNSKVYVARIGPGVCGIDGNAVASAAWSFTTIASAPPPDTTRPKVSGFTPVSGATSVAVATSPKVTMSEQIQSGTATSTFFSLRLSGGTVVSNSISLSAADLKTVTMAVSGGTLGFSGHYFMVVTSGVKDLAGNNMSGNVSGQFRTVGISFPKVSGHSPLSGATDVAVSVSPTITFDRQMQSGFANGTYFDLLDESSNEVNKTFSLDSTLRIFTMNPVDNLLYDHTYTMRAQSGIKDLSGNGFSGTLITNFTTTLPALNIVYNVTSDSNNDLGRGADGHDLAEGVKVATSSSQLKGTVPKQVRLRLAKVGSPTGTLDVGIWTGAGPGLGTGTLKQSIGSMSVASLTTSFANYDFTNVNATYTMQTGDYIYISFDFSAGFTDSSNFVRIRYNSADVFDGTNTIRAIIGPADKPTSEFGAIVWE